MPRHRVPGIQTVPKTHTGTVRHRDGARTIVKIHLTSGKWVTERGMKYGATNGVPQGADPRNPLHWLDLTSIKEIPGVGTQSTEGGEDVGEAGG